MVAERLVATTLGAAYYARAADSQPLYTRSARPDPPPVRPLAREPIGA
jgi:hypothetical protein